ncbi:MAG: DNA primase DnaG [Candidatus Nanoarchaeia archaeon]|nr:DNA primase DnaG [Candidatus Nanoarchaeia archaeon]MDD5357736.1 DNA primase DnaG [Candidatus Nanoarchaeia archaeon]MDD5588655.1 DNA primase DnaG [Candidatus Nanoarchaeia archaeon]
MAKISPVSIKYMIHANFSAEGALEKPDVIGAIFGQTEGLLGAELEMRELQKEGKIGRIEVDLHKEGKKTVGVIKIPTAVDQSETTLIAAAIETIERIGPCDSQIEVERIEDVRGSKRDYIVERAKKLMQEIHGKTDSREISTEIKESAKIAGIKEYGDGKLPAGDISGKELIVVEGRADVVNLLRNGVNNVIGMNGTKLPDEIRELGKEKEITLFVDGDRGGKLIAQNVVENADVKYIAVAPDGKEVEELAGKEILMALRKKIPAREFFSKKEEQRSERKKEFELGTDEKDKLRKIENENKGSGKAVLLDNSLNEIKKVSVKTLASSLSRSRDKPTAIVIDGTATTPIIISAEEIGTKVIAAKNFATTDTSIKLMSL